MRALPWRHVPHGQAVLWQRVVPSPDVDGGLPLLLLRPLPLLPPLLLLLPLLLLRLLLGDAVVVLGAACEGGSLLVSTPAGVAGVSVRSSGVEEVEVGAVGIGDLSGVVSESGGGAVSH